ncbi:flagellar biosynthesis protein FlhA, partial [Buchnera aphidicola (Hormaphis cornu)]
NFEGSNNKHLMQELSWNDLQLEDVIRIELGKDLMETVNTYIQDNLLIKIRGIRKNFAQEIGFLPPLVHIKNNFDLKSFMYKIVIKGVEVARGEAYINFWLAIDTGNVAIKLPGKEVCEPTFGLKAYWIDKSLLIEAKNKGFTVVDVSSVIATHFNQVIYKNMDELFGCYETQKLLEQVNKKLPRLTEELIPNVISLSIVSKILKNLLSEQISIRDMKTIIETLLNHAVSNKDSDFLTGVVRIELGKFITQKLFLNNKVIKIIGLDVKLENILIQSLEAGQSAIEPGLSDMLLEQTKKAIHNQKLIQASIVLVVNHPLRAFLSRFLRSYFSALVVLSHLEIKDNRTIYVTSVIGKMN